MEPKVDKFDKCADSDKVKLSKNQLPLHKQIDNAYLEKEHNKNLVDR